MQTGTKMMVRAAKRIVRASSLGVFWRSAPSTKAIIRSRKVCPGSAVIRTTMRSESTRVPPVTAERSPPLSLITGADSPVIADSSIEATPSTTSPSEGTMSLASQTTRSPLTSPAAATLASVPSELRRRAMVSARIRRSVSDWARPRPSAVASAKLAKRTVTKRVAVTTQSNTDGWKIDETKVTSVPSRTTNITGFLTCVRGSSLTKESMIALPRMSLVIQGSWRRPLPPPDEPATASSGSPGAAVAGLTRAASPGMALSSALMRRALRGAAIPQLSGRERWREGR